MTIHNASVIADRRRRWTATVSGVALIAAFAPFGAAHAQDVSQPATGQIPAESQAVRPRSLPDTGPATAPSPTSTSSVVQEVVVTAERRAVNVQTTAISISAISGNQLQEKQIVTINDLQTQTPGLSVTAGGQTNNVNIRGLGNTAASPSITTGVAIFRDGLYEPEAILLNEPFFDIADAEVLRGPQGTIVGQNSTGGALQINSRNPNFNGVNGYIEGVAGNYNEGRISGAVNLPIVSDILAARVAFSVENRDSFYTDIGQKINGGSQAQDHPGQYDEKSVRIGLLFKPNEQFQALFKAELNDLDNGGTPGKPLPPANCTLPGCNAASGYYQYGYNGPSVYNGFRTLGPFDLDYNHPETGEETANRFSLELRYKLANGITLRSLTGYQTSDQLRTDDVDKSAAPNNAAVVGQYDFFDVGPNNDYYSQEFNILSPDTGKFTWLLGASYFYRHTPVEIRQYPDLDGVTPNPQNVGADFVFQTNSIQRLGGVYGQASYQLTSTLQIQVGARYSFDANQGGGYLIPGTPTTLLPFTVSASGNYSESEPTGKVTLNWTPLKGQFFYAFFARGYKEGGTDAGAPNFAPEFVNDFEGGWKGRLFDGRLQTQLGGYYMQYQSLQQQVINPAVGTNQVVNLGDSTLYGIEASAQAKFGQLALDFGFAYNHSELGAIKAVASYELPGQGSAALGPQCAAGQSSGCFDYTPYTVNLQGEANPYAPEITLNFTASYSIPLWEGVLTPRASFSYQSKQYASIFQNTDFYLLGERRLVDGFLSYKKGDWEAELFARNLTDQRYLSGISGLNNSFEGDPRTYGVRIARTF